MSLSRLSLVLCLACIAGCNGKDSSQKTVARFDDRTLTLEEVRARLDSSQGLSAAQVNEYARRWINDEILYREAIRRGLDKNTNVQAQLEDARRQLVINALLQEEVYTPKTLESSQEQVAQYFSAHTKEFSLPSDVVLMSYLLFRDRDAANGFRTAVLQGESWVHATARILADPRQASMIVARVDSMYYTQNTLVPIELWRVASASAKSEPSFPVRTNDNFYIIIVWKLMRQGQVADLAYVEDEIRSRLAIEQRRRALDSLIETLRAGHAVELMAGEEADTASSRPGKEE